MTDRRTRRLEAEIEAIIAHPEGTLGRLRDLEVQRGGKVVMPGAYLPFIFPKDDWDDCVVSIKDREVRLVLINARNPGHGAFTRLVKHITDFNLTPVVVAPFPHMEAILVHWGWVYSPGDDWLRADEWRPK